MTNKPPDSELIKFIETKHPEYYGKICELREAIEGWLSYVPHTFPHYTRHTIKHSDTIVSQMSKLLFRDHEAEPVIKLSGVEAYILVAAAYLHDAGMVTPDREKAAILESDEWKSWTTGSGNAAGRWEEIQKFRNQADSENLDSVKRNFLADIQTRFLIAEFIRAKHHLRAATVIEVHHDQLGRIDFGDHMLREAIAQVCVGHGLRQHELEDNERFPDRWDIREETVNLRFLAILLRLGDLLDMSVDRACPLLLNAASPLPPESLAHWSQYSAIRRRVTSPDKIGVLAECANQEEHRVLQDWCQWIVGEIRNAEIVIPKCQRHNDWRVPEAVMDGDSPTIKIRPAAGANYIPSKWSLKFDQYGVFELLSKDLYQKPTVFVRELIQNSLDAMRCKMYADLRQEGLETPEYPTQVPESFRNRYKLKVSVSNREFPNQLAGQSETKQVLAIEDNGIGMDEEIIERYFLQVGRSFYQSEEFRRNFQFVPTSRFGIGFLSVFAASDLVTVETFKPSSDLPNNAPVRITLTGLRQYLLREKSAKRTAGTRIEVVLREDIKQGELTKMISDWCRRVEFPILVDDFGNEKTIVKEKPEDFIYEESLINDPNAKFVLRAFPFDRHGIEGEIYILAYIDERGESWAYGNRQIVRYIDSQPFAKEPYLPARLECFHGIEVNDEDDIFLFQDRMIWRVDIRNKGFTPDLSRNRGILSDGKFKSVIGSFYEKIMAEHLRSSGLAEAEEGWKYKQELADYFDIGEFWNRQEKMLPIYRENEFRQVSFDELTKSESLVTIFSKVKNEYLSDERSGFLNKLQANTPVIKLPDVDFISSHFKRNIFSHFNNLSEIKFLSDREIALVWSRDDSVDKNPYRMSPDNEFYSLEFKNEKLIGLAIPYTPGYRRGLLLNLNHPFTAWLQLFKDACKREKYNLNITLFNKFIRLLAGSATNPSESNLKALNNYLSELKNYQGFPKEIWPPDIEISPDMFF